MAGRFATSSSRPTAASSSSRRGATPSSGRRSERGFSLVEVLFSTLILVVGLLSVAQLLAVSIKAESMARNGALGTRWAQGKLDDLMKANFDTNPQVQVTPGGVDSLAADVPNYNDVPPVGPMQPRIIRRWRVVAGPAGTRILAVRVLVGNGSTTARAVDLTTLVRRW